MNLTPENWFWLAVRLTITIIMLSLMAFTYTTAKAHGAHIGYLVGVLHGALLHVLLVTLYVPK